MAGPDSILNLRSQSTDTLYGADGVRKGKLAVGDIDAGLDDAVAYQGIATALDGDSFDSGTGQIGVVTVAGVDVSGPTVRRILVDSLGQLQIGQIADDTGPSAGYYVFPVGFSADETSTDSVDENDLGAARMTLDRRQIVVVEAYAKGGATPYHSGPSAASNNATSVKASPGKLTHIQVNNLNGSVRYLKFYNKASAPTPASDTVVYSVPIPPGATVVEDFADGMDFSTGIAYALVTGVSDTDNTGVSANEHVVNLTYM
jgi:hypothetical protein